MGSVRRLNQKGRRKIKTGDMCSNGRRLYPMKLVETSKSDGIRDGSRWISTSSKGSGTEPGQESSDFPQTNPTANTTGGVRESATETVFDLI